MNSENCARLFYFLDTLFDVFRIIGRKHEHALIMRLREITTANISETLQLTVLNISIAPPPGSNFKLQYRLRLS